MVRKRIRRRPRRHASGAAGVVVAAIALALPAMPGFAAQRLADEDVERAIDSQYFLDAAVDANRITVDVHQGIAELTGTVHHLLAKERATEIAELVKGVRAVSNRIRVVPSDARTDTQIRRDVQAALLRDPATESYEIGVAVDDHVVTLTGQVDSWAEKQLSATVAKGVRGVVDVRNDVAVVYGADRPDSEIRAEVSRRLDWDVLVGGHLIDVAVTDGQVTLDGTVGSAAEKRQAESDAWKAGGVTAVDASGLEVSWWAEDEDLRKERFAKRKDAEIESAIEDAALYDPRVSSFAIEANVDHGWVTLRGGVDNLEAKKAAEQLARNTVGVSGISNQLKVRSEDPPADPKIREQVEASLAVNPVTSPYEIDVAVSDGWVTLEGNVDGYFEKVEAEDEAAKVDGVVAVRNRLEAADTVSYVLPYYYYPWAPYPAPIVVRPTRTASDHAIQEQIEREFLWSPFVDGDSVEVRVSGGVATLEGSVDSWREYHAAADNAYEGGAASVENEIVVTR
jgi:osmotically-inducible protein OsmY